MRSLSFDLALNPDFGPLVAERIEALSGGLSGPDLVRLLESSRGWARWYLSEAAVRSDPVDRWQSYRRAYFWYGFIEAVTEASLFSATLVPRVVDRLGDQEGWEILGQIDQLQPSELTKLHDSGEIDPDLLALPEVSDYLWIKRWQDDQNRFHNEVIMPGFRLARQEFDAWRAEALPEFDSLSSRDALAAALLVRQGLVPLDQVARLLVAMPQASLTAIVGGKGVGLARLLLLGARVPSTWVVPVGTMPSVEQLAALPAERWAVRSSGTVEDGESTSFAGMFLSELDVAGANLVASIGRVKASAKSRRVAIYVAEFGTDDPHMAVPVQVFRGAEFAGVWLGAGIDGGRMEWVEGTGEKLVSGRATPHAEVWQGGRLDIAPIMSREGSVGEYCLALQAKVGKPLDLEWAILADGYLWMLQLRPVTRDLVAVEDTDEPVAQEGDILTGVAASAGCITGVVIQLADADDPGWQPGAVLVTQATDPDWIHVLKGAAAVVTVEGGATSHTAIVARELGIPCVTGVPEALRLTTGMTVEVYGNRGTVRIVS